MNFNLLPIFTCLSLVLGAQPILSVESAASAYGADTHDAIKVEDETKQQQSNYDTLNAVGETNKKRTIKDALNNVVENLERGLNFVSYQHYQLFIKDFNSIRVRYQSKHRSASNVFSGLLESLDQHQQALVVRYLKSWRPILALYDIIRLNNVCSLHHINEIIDYETKYLGMYGEAKPQKSVKRRKSRRTVVSEKDPLELVAPPPVDDLFRNYVNVVGLKCSTNVNKHIKENEWLVKQDLNELCNLVKCAQDSNYKPDYEDCVLSQNAIKEANLGQDRATYENAMSIYINHALVHKLGQSGGVLDYVAAFKSLLVDSCLRLEQLYSGSLQTVMRLSEMGYALNWHHLETKYVDKWAQVMKLCDLLLKTKIDTTVDGRGKDTIEMTIQKQRAYQQLESIDFKETLTESDIVFQIDTPLSEKQLD